MHWRQWHIAERHNSKTFAKSATYGEVLVRDCALQGLHLKALTHVQNREVVPLHSFAGCSSLRRMVKHTQQLRGSCRAAANSGQPAVGPQLVLYSKPGCHLCEGLKVHARVPGIKGVTLWAKALCSSRKPGFTPPLV